MAKYQAYPEYKDSGVEWIDSIPLHWEVKPTFALCDASAKKNSDGAENNVLSLSYGSIIPRDVDTNFGLLPESFNTYQIINYGDVILRLTDLQNDKNSLRVGLAKQKGIITSAYLKLKAENDINSAFLYRLLHSYDTTKVFYGMGGGLRQSMKFEDFRRLPLLLPPKEEQLNISTFLEHETAKIDNLIEKQQQLIELLKEKRQAVISHAVTKGLNPNVPMRDSGVEWLGEVPEHWGVKPLRYLGDCQNGINIGAEAFGSGYPFVSYGDAYKNRILPEIGSGLVQSTAEDRKKYSLLTGDMLFTRTSETIEEIGFSSACLKTIENVCFAGFLIRFRPNSLDLNVEYSKYYFSNQLLRTFFTKEMNLITRASLSQDLLKTMPVVIPPRDEQRQISELLDEKSKRFEQLQLLGEEQIMRLKERRTALISAAVTGKIDVRNWVAPEAEKAEVSQEVTA